MPNDMQIEIYRALRASQDRYTYFLLAAVGAAIAFAVNQTQGTTLGWSHWPLGVAVVSWGLSFYFGCRHILYVNATLYSNADLLLVQSGRHPQAGSHPQLMQVADEVIREAIERDSKKSARFGMWQFWCLLTGALFYIGWHVSEMYARAELQV